MPYNPTLNSIRGRLKREREKTHAFIKKCKQNKPSLNPARLCWGESRNSDLERTGGRSAAIDQELEAYFRGPR